MLKLVVINIFSFEIIDLLTKKIFFKPEVFSCSLKMFNEDYVGFVLDKVCK
jgi:hypothetical protein